MNGLDPLLREVRELIDRPRWRWSEKHRDLRGEQALPLLCLIGEPEATKAVTEALAARLNPDPRGLDRVPSRLIPSASVDAALITVDAGDGRPVLPLLNHLVKNLSSDRFGAGKEIPFHTFRLVDWLTRHRQSTLERNQQAPLRSKLLEWYAPTSPEGEGTELLSRMVGAVAPEKALDLTRLMPRLLSRFGRWLWLRGLRGGEPRWLMRQRFMVPKHSADFLGFARRLTTDARENENLEQLKLLLVRAFLRDLRRFYGTRTWWLRRWRRTAYLTAVLHGITEVNGGWELLHLINDVRNQTGEHDPLLVIATATDLPDSLDVKPGSVRTIKEDVADWKKYLPRRRQQFRPAARFLVIRLDGEDPASWHDADSGRHWEPRKIPWFARKPAVVAAVLLLLAGTGASTMAMLPEPVPDPCGVAGFPEAGAVLMPETGECVGVSAGGYVFGSTGKLRKAQEAVFEQNEIAERLHETNPDRSIVTLVYFAELTHPDTREGTDDAEAEEVTGLLIQQSQYNTVGNSTEDALNPLLRIVVANGGYQMRHARRTVDRFIAPLAERDPTVMGVVGGGRSVTQTESAIGALGAFGIPIVATTLTGDSLPALSPLYFQMVAGNRPQARLVAEYAAATGRTVTVYHPDLVQEPDQYLSTLHDRFAELAHGRSSIRLRQWRTPSTVEVDCRADDIAFYAGRETGFTDFLNHVLDGCPATGKPTIIGDDAVTRFIAQGESRRSDRFSNVSLGYVSLANRVVLAGSSCVSEGKPAVAGSDPDGQRPLTIFCAGLRGLYSPRDDRPAGWQAFGAELAAHGGNRRWTGERVGTAYDAAGLYLTAVNRNKLRAVPEAGKLAPNRATVAQEFREFDCSDSMSAACFKGVSGRIDFRAGRDGADRPLAVVTIDDITAVDANPVCTFRFQDSAPCP
ncbi:hypothetical protein [Amycolatopsis plumensis]|uniref:ABC-type branched-chain amino acid transport system, substrate-binding protein n=1 Tax=Amycolatopsis plumensis TaxID=236508 RepID=A0ABV5TXL5_9PSEU